jgi:uracil-DNA glycosylase family 4
MNRIDKLQYLYNKIYDCDLCSKVERDKEKEVPRKADRDKILSKIALMAQAPSKTGVRLSGIHWVREDDSLLPGDGPFIEKYLNMIGFSLMPSKPYNKCYTTNALHCWTGPDKKGDRKPSDDELNKCKEWWLQELKIINPEIIILLGKQPVRAFDIATNNRIKKMINQGMQGEEILIKDFGLKFQCFIAPHPSWRDYWKKKDEYDKVFSIIKESLLNLGI